MDRRRHPWDLATWAGVVITLLILVAGGYASYLKLGWRLDDNDAKNVDRDKAIADHTTKLQDLKTEVHDIHTDTAQIKDALGVPTYSRGPARPH